MRYNPISTNVLLVVTGNSTMPFGYNFGYKLPLSSLDSDLRQPENVDGVAFEWTLLNLKY